MVNILETIELLINNIDSFFGILSRITGFFIAVPIFSNNNIPQYTKIGFSFILALIVFPIINDPHQFINESLLGLFLFIFKELALGIILGFICYLFFSVVYLAGHIVDMELGFSIASVINPEDESEIPLMANLFYMIAALIFFSINGHHLFIKGIVDSFRVVPLGSLSFNLLMVETITGIVVNSFIIAIKMSGPVLVSIFLSNILLGIFARTMPQMNVFDVGIPLKILVGLIILLIILPLYDGVFEFLFNKMYKNLTDFLITIIKG